jgi:capsule biosynthesis phosphatase
MKRLVFDLDNTLTHSADKGEVDYKEAAPNLEMIEKVREYKQKGFSIVIFSSRNMRSYNNSIGLITARTVPIIIEWLDRHGVPYDEIHVGKPWCGEEGFYVDDKAIRPSEFLTLSYEQIQRLIGSGKVA